MTLKWPTLYDQEPSDEQFAACNVGLAEWRRRRRMLRLFAPLALLGLLVLLIGPFGRDEFRLYALPIYLWGLLYLQVRLRHCAGFGLLGVVGLDPANPGRTGRATGEIARRLRLRTLVILLAPLLPALLWFGAVSLLMPVCR